MTSREQSPPPTTPGTPAGQGGVRLYTRGPVSHAWLARYAVPAWQRASEGGRRLAHLRRGWRYGPHVDLVVDGASPAQLRDLAQGLDAGPAPAAGEAVTETDYLPMARELGRLEAVPPPYLPMRRHGDVEILDATEVGTGEPALDELRLVCGSRLGVPVAATLSCLALGPERAPRRIAEILTAMADTHALGIGYGVFSLHSHVEGFFAWTAPTADVRPAFEDRYAGQADLYREVVRDRIAGTADHVAASWRNALGYCSGVVDAAVSRGAVTGAMLDSASGAEDVSHLGPPGAPAHGPTGSQPDTDFHRAVHAAGVEASHGGWFTGYRLLVNFAYEQFPLLGVAPMQRYFTCYAVARAIDEELGSTWQERLDNRTEDAMEPARG